jgi:hypothetical protein
MRRIARGHHAGVAAFAGDFADVIDDREDSEPVVEDAETDYDAEKGYPTRAGCGHANLPALSMGGHYSDSGIFR